MKEQKFAIFAKKCIDCKNFFLYSQFKDYYFKIPDRKRNYALLLLCVILTN